MVLEFFSLNIAQKTFLEQVFFAISLLLLFWGQRTYRILLFVPSFLIGISMMQSHFFSFSTGVRLGWILGIGVLGVGLVIAVEQFMIAMVGAFLGGGCMHYFGWDLYLFLEHIWNIESTTQHHTVPWYYTSLSAFLGAFLFSAFFERYLPITTALCGSMMLCWAIGFRDITNYHFCFLFWLLGCIVQYKYQPVRKTKNYQKPS